MSIASITGIANWTVAYTMRVAVNKEYCTLTRFSSTHGYWIKWNDLVCAGKKYKTMQITVEIKCRWRLTIRRTMNGKRRTIRQVWWLMVTTLYSTDKTRPQTTVEVWGHCPSIRASLSLYRVVVSQLRITARAETDNGTTRVIAG